MDHIFSSIPTVLRSIFSFFFRGRGVSLKSIHVKIVERGCVCEVMEELPFYLVDEKGDKCKGIYVVQLIVWNRGIDGVRPDDFVKSAPFIIELIGASKIAHFIALDEMDDTGCSLSRSADNAINVHFESLRPGDYFLISLFVTDDPYVGLNVKGRIAGQPDEIDHTADEMRASWIERITCLICILMIINAFIFVFAWGWIINDRYGFKSIINGGINVDDIPYYFMGPFSLGIGVDILFLISRIVAWWERRRWPEGFPLYSDFEPPIKENLKAMWDTFRNGTKHRLSLSFFDWAKPVVIPKKNIRRRSVKNWVS